MADCIIGPSLICQQCGRGIRAAHIRRNCTFGLAIPSVSRRPLPGTELKRLLQDWLGIEPTHGCSCNSMAARMDALGPEWCESDDGMAEILGVMREEHAKRRAAGQTILPWSDFGATQLVRLACRRARAT